MSESNGRTISVAGGTLFRVALAEYGDALAWTRLAEANGLTDPWLTGPVTLVVPPRGAEASTGGILGGA